MTNGYGKVYDFSSDGHKPAPYVDLTQLIITLNLSKDTDFIENLPQQIDVSNLLREIVVEASTGNHDAYGLSANNYR
jgi:spore coat protein CotH